MNNLTVWLKLAVGAALIGLLAFAGYQLYRIIYTAGERAANAQWEERYSKDVAALNGTIAQNEKDLKEEAARLKERDREIATMLAQHLQEINNWKDKYNRKMYDAAGIPVCQQDTDLHLGKDFSDKWNEMGASQ